MDYENVNIGYWDTLMVSKILTLIADSETAVKNGFQDLNFSIYKQDFTCKPISIIGKANNCNNTDKT